MLCRTSPTDEEACWLELAAEYDLAGTIESLVTLQSRAPGIQRDAVLLTFRSAIILQTGTITSELPACSL